MFMTNDAAPARPEPADLIVNNGKIATQDPAGPMARAVAIKDGRFVAAGTSD